MSFYLSTIRNLIIKDCHIDYSDTNRINIYTDSIDISKDEYFKIYIETSHIQDIEITKVLCAINYNILPNNTILRVEAGNEIIDEFCTDSIERDNNTFYIDVTKVFLKNFHFNSFIKVTVVSDTTINLLDYMKYNYTKNNIYVEFKTSKYGLKYLLFDTLGNDNVLINTNSWRGQYLGSEDHNFTIYNSYIKVAFVYDFEIFKFNNPNIPFSLRGIKDLYYMTPYNYNYLVEFKLNGLILLITNYLQETLNYVHTGSGSCSEFDGKKYCTSINSSYVIYSEELEQYCICYEKDKEIILLSDGTTYKIKYDTGGVVEFDYSNNKIYFKLNENIIHEITIVNEGDTVKYICDDNYYVVIDEYNIKYYMGNILTKHLYIRNNTFEEKINNICIECNTIMDDENISGCDVDKYEIKYTKGKIKKLKITSIGDTTQLGYGTIKIENDNNEFLYYNYDLATTLKEVLNTKTELNQYVYPKLDMNNNIIYGEQTAEIDSINITANTDPWTGVTTYNVNNDKFVKLIGQNIIKVSNSLTDEKILKKEINCNIMPKEAWRVLLFVKYLSNYHGSVKVKITFVSPETEENNYIIEQELIKHYYDFQVIDKVITADRRYRQVKIEVIMNNVTNVYVGNLYCYKSKQVYSNKYDDESKVQTLETSSKIVEYLYDHNRLIGYKTSSGDYITNELNLDRNIVFDHLNGIESIEEYDSLGRISRRVKTNSRNLKEEHQYIYDTNIKNNVVKLIENDKEWNIEYNDNNQISKQYYSKHKNNKYITYSTLYDYNNNDIIKLTNTKNVQDGNNNTLYESFIQYNKINNELNTYNGYQQTILAGNNKYDIYCDKYNRDTLIKINDEEVQDIVYNDTLSSDVVSNKIKEISNYNSDLIKAWYSENKLASVKRGTKATIYSYLPQLGIGRSKVAKMIHGNLFSIEAPVNENNINVSHTIEYSYDNQYRPVEIKNNDTIFKYQYDNNDNIKYEQIKTNNYVQHIFYNNIQENKFNTVYGLIEKMNNSNLNDYMFPNKCYEMMYSNTCDCNEVDYVYDDTLGKMIYSFKDNNSRLGINLNEINSKRIDGQEYLGIKYSKDSFQSELVDNKIISMWFRISLNNLSNTTNTILLTLKGTGQNYVKVVVDENNNIKLQTLNDVYNSYIKVISDEWMYIEVVATSILEVRLNNQKNTYDINCNNLLGNLNKFTIGDENQNENITEKRFNFDVMFVSVGNKQLINSEDNVVIDEVNKYINSIKEDKSSQAIIYNKKNTTCFIPLNGTYINDNVPIDYIVSKSFTSNNDKDLFYYDSSIKRYVHCSRLENSIYSLLGYNFGLKEKYALNINFKLMEYPEINTKNYILSNYDINKVLKWALLLKDSGEILVVKNDRTTNTIEFIDTDIYLKLDEWYNITIINDDNFKIKVDLLDDYNDNNEITLGDTNSYSLEDCFSYIGSNIQVSNNVVKPINNVSGFFNSIEYVDGINQTLSEDLLNEFYNNLPITISNEFDSDNKLKQKRINCNNKEFTYHYRYYENEYINYIPTAEYNPCNELINYEYDDFNNVVVKEIVNSSGDIIEKYNYEYDFLNRLTKEYKYVISEQGLVLDYEYIYTYDQNSNIIQKIKNNDMTTFTYATNDSEELYSNVLLSTTKNGQTTTFTYNSLEGPTKITKGDEEINIVWTNGELTGYGELLFEYDELGLRTKKINQNSITNYYYNNDLLIKSVKDNVIINYLYDINNQLFGFEYNSKTYLYIRDLLGNINQIVDSNGNVMVKYSYTAFGEVTIENPYSVNHNLHQLSELLIEHNALLYKGYCYDFETQLFYCNSRYYSPELCRWISPDSIEYLDPKSINGLNLYCYCENNPVMGYDPNGNVNWWKVGAIALAAAAVITGTVLTVVTFGAGSVAGTIAITAAITLAAKTAEVATLQVKKSMADGDDASDIFTDVIDAIAGNSLKIIGLTPLTKTSGFASGIYSQSYSFAQTWQLMRLDGFNIGNALGGSIYALKDRFANIGQYMSMNTTGFGYAIAYGFAALEVGHLVYSIFENDYLRRANQRGYKLY